MPNALVIVESPAKAKTIAGYLGAGYVVESSIGHIRDLPRSAKDVPPAYKNEPWARLGIDVDNDFKPLYVISPDRKDTIKKLKALVKQVDEVYLATDEDREGEAIAWHLLEVLSPRVPVKRMVFHEITPKAIREALDHPRDIDRRLVDAQEARRLLDRLYGYEVSPVLWKKVGRSLSAGRVQSVATRIVVERERERMRFVPASYWDLQATFAVREARSEPDGAPATFAATLQALDSTRIATGKDFDSEGSVRSDDVVVLTRDAAGSLATALQGATFTVRSVESKPYRRRPAAPFMTSTFQQEASRKLRLSSAQAMRVAQSLYEKGYITYMRTDSTTLSDTAVNAARSIIRERFGPEYLPDAPRTYANKVKNAQEAHEAIRPAGDVFRSPEDVARELSPDGHETQPPPRYTEASLVKRLEELGVGRPSTYASIMATIQERGYVWKKGSALVPSFTAFSVVTLLERHFPNLVDYAFTARMEDDLDNIAGGTESAVPWLARFYFGDPSGNGSSDPGLKRMVSEKLAEIDARDINSIPLGVAENGEPVVARVGKYGPYVQCGDRSASIPDDIPPDELTVERAMQFIEAPQGDRSLGIDPETGLEVFAKAGRFGPYVQLGEHEEGSTEKPKTASLFKSMSLDTITLDEALALLSLPRTVGVDPADGVEVTVQNGRFGPFVKKGNETRSLESEEQLLTITLEECLQLLAEPKRRRGQAAPKPPLRTLGEDPVTGRPMVVKEGRFGPYVTDGETNASLRKGDTVEELTDERAAELLAERRARGPVKKAAKKAAKK
ncbi:MAG TPA: type I DNA topoisomerase, partial [Acidimicrobiales bacterium]